MMMSSSTADATGSCRTEDTSVGHVSFDLDEALNAPWSLGRQMEESESSVDSMPTVLFNIIGDTTICTVCREGHIVGTDDGAGGGVWKRVPCCGHVYHAECISSWLCHRDSCPLCRFTILRAA
ncbi:E3 ubiquitin-protein ligase synoviolin A [Linum grandiflorum]